MQDRAMNFGLGTVMVALLAAGTGRGMQQHEAQSPKRGPLAVERAAATATPASAPLLEDSIITGTALLEEFFGDSLARLAPCTNPSLCYDLDFLIVTLPDPLDSFLDWAFDADLESMRRASESAQFVTNRFWLPWDHDRKVVSGTPATHYRRAHPGVFLLRNSNPTKHRLRLVYVVGEISTGGVHKRALEAALDERRTLLGKGLFADSSGARDTIRFVGPFFTGSALSMRLTLERWRRATGDTSFALFVSGAATGAANLIVFDSSHTAAKPAVRMSFHATVNADVTLSLAMLHVMVDSLGGLGIPADHIALVQESSTQYGQQALVNSQPPDSKDPAVLQAAVPHDKSQRKAIASLMDEVANATREMLVIPYPMSISSLRSEYAKHPSSAKNADEFDRAAEPRIPLALYDSNQQLESPIPVAQLTPAALELMIDEIAQALKAHDIRAIGLIGTDVRDRIFLADQLRKRIPDARLFTFGSNNLYLREDYNNSLRGMLVFSTYPLLLQNQWWDVVNSARVKTARPRRLAFPSDDAQGVFNATLRQLGRKGLREYRAPFDTTGEYPPVWVTAVGRHSFIPIRTLRSLGGADQYLEARPPYAGVSAATPEDHVSHSDWVRWLIYIAAAGTILFVVLRDDVDSRTRVPIRKDVSPPGGTSTEEMALGRRAALLLHREIYTFLRHLAILCVFAALAVIIVPQADEYKQLSGASPVVYSLLGLTAVGTLIAFGVRLYRVWRAWGEVYRDYIYRPSRPIVERETHALSSCAERSVWRREGIIIGITAMVGMLYAAAVARLILDLKRLDVSDAALFVHRAAQLDSGVSPIFPIVVSSAALAILCTWQLSRLILLDEVTAFEEAFQLSSTTPTQTDGDEIKGRIAKGLDAARMHLSRVVPDLPSGMSKLLAGLLLVVLASALWIHFEPSFEAITGLRRMGQSTAFDVIFRLSILMIFAASAWALARLIIVWRALRMTLGALDASPLITAFERLPRRIARLTRLTLFTDPSRETVLAVTATQWMHLRSLFHANEQAFKQLSPSVTADVHRLMQSDAPLHGRNHRRAGVTFAGELKQMLRLIESFWATEPETAQVDAVLADLKANAPNDGMSTSGRIRRSFPDAVRLWVRSAEEFVAVQAVDYIAWVLRHLRRLVLMLLFLLAVTIALLSSYSFFPQSVVRSLFLLLFIAVVVALLLMLSQMNRDEVLSRVTRTDPGRVNWNAGFLLNVGMVVAIPILSLVSAFSPLRTDLFGWVDVALRALSKH